MITKKLYYNTKLTSCLAKIIDIRSYGIILDKTVSFPEGGGQEGDHGIISLKHSPNVKISFIDTQLINATVSSKLNSPTCKIGGEIIHKYNLNNEEVIKILKIGDEVKVDIDIKRRDLLTKSHSATHLMYIAIDIIKDNIVNNIIGCHIKVDGGRLDFKTEYRFSNEEIKLIEEKANSIINENLSITMTSDKDNNELRYWLCNNYIIPCGGTHVENTGSIPFIKVSRKSIGKGKERVLFNWR